MKTLQAPERVLWTAEPGLGLYVHVPFCAHRCHYCDFNTYEGQEELYERYVDALVAEILRDGPAGRPVATIFFGGGTPTLLPPAELGRVLAAVPAASPVADDVEITVEANPETLSPRVLDGLLAAGFTRLSMGIQSAAAPVLAGLGRTHTAERAFTALRDARTAGFREVNADLIFGSPWESERDWQLTLDAVVDAAPEHVSAYALTVEEGTPLATFVGTGRVPDVDPDVQAARYETAQAALAAAGFARYEISNWARPGHECRHNLVYWCHGDYLAYGAGAHGHMSGRRWWRERLPRTYVAEVEAGRSTIAGDEVLGADERAGEALMLGLRLTAGVPLAGFEQRFGAAALARRSGDIADLERLGLVVSDDARLRLTERGTLVANEVLARVL